MNVIVTYSLILFAHVGSMGDGNSNTLAVVSGFTNEAGCKQAGEQSKKLVSGTVKDLRYVCVRVDKYADIKGME